MGWDGAQLFRSPFSNLLCAVKGMFGETAEQTPEKYIAKYPSGALCYFFSL